MNSIQWNAFCSFRDAFKDQCKIWATHNPTLIPLQTAASASNTPPYPIETPVVYNTALDEITKESDIKLIVIGDNPGKNEQLALNQKYLVGQAGKIAQGFFTKNPCFNIDFRKNAIILNKTPIHTAKTAHLKALASQGGKPVADLILESQLWMAQQTAALHQALFRGQDTSQDYSTKLWLVGYGELKGKGIFLPYRDAFYKAYQDDIHNNAAWKNVFVYQHFSMNCFLNDLNKFRQEPYKDQNLNSQTKKMLPLPQAVIDLGRKHRDEIFV
ncbi:MAG: hypothetical protein MJ169_03975 [Treponema sp.]|nr:hypothetical protein [Treponema sp.]